MRISGAMLLTIWIVASKRYDSLPHDLKGVYHELSDLLNLNSYHWDDNNEYSSVRDIIHWVSINKDRLASFDEYGYHRDSSYYFFNIRNLSLYLMNNDDTNDFDYVKGLLASIRYNVDQDHFLDTFYDFDGSIKTERSYIVRPPRRSSIMPIDKERQYFVSKAPNKVIINTTFFISFYFSITHIDNSLPIDMEFKNGEIDLEINIESQDLIILSDSSVDMKAIKGRDSQEKRFEVKSLKEGYCKYFLNVWKEGVLIASSERKILVISEDELKTKTRNRTVETFIDINRPLLKNELVFCFSYDKDVKKCKMQLRGGKNGIRSEIFESEVLGDDLPVLIQKQIASINDKVNNSYKMGGEYILDLLGGMGKIIWDSIVPKDFQQIFLSELEGVDRISIYSSYDPVPWELMYISNNELDFFLVERFVISRWIYGSLPNKEIHSDLVRLVLPTDAPNAAPQEINQIKKLLPSSGVITNINELLNLFRKKIPLNILHFACHNITYDTQPDTSYTKISGMPFEQTVLAKWSGLYKTIHPLIFMNACRSAASAPGFTGFTGWAKRYVDIGAGAFIGTLWNVRDTYAAQFSETFYQSLLQGSTLGEAMRAGRERIAEQGKATGDPTWLAYVLYGDPDARLDLPSISPISQETEQKP